MVTPPPLPTLLMAAIGGSLALAAALPSAVPSAVAAAPAEPVVAVLAADRSPVGAPQALPEPEPVPDDSDLAAARASRSQRRAAPAEPPPPPAPVLPGCDASAGDTSGYANGRLPGSVLCDLADGSEERLRADAAVAFHELAAAYAAQFGVPLCVIDGYRTLGEQQSLRRTKPRFAARPGSSDHGWGLAVDLGCEVKRSRTAEHRLMRDNAPRFGWDLPEWARPGGSRPEPWHWEYVGPTGG